MNPMTNIKNLQKINERELELGIIGNKSWHDEYKGSAWIFIGGLPYDLTEGDIICVFSQYGEIVNINLVRDSKTGKSKGYSFICFQDQRSTVLTVDNLNGIKILGRTIRVDHVKDYKMPKGRGDEDEVTLKLHQEGCAPKIESSSEEVENAEEVAKSKRKKEKKKKMKKEKRKKKKKEKDSSAEDDNNSSSESDKEETRHPHTSTMDVKREKLDIKEEKMDSGYDSALRRPSANVQSSRHNNSDEDVRERRRNREYDRLDDHATNGVKKEVWDDDRERGRYRKGGAGSEWRDNRSNDGQQYNYNRNRDTDNRKYDRDPDRHEGGKRDAVRFESSRDHHKYQEREYSRREGRDRTYQRKDNQGKYGGEENRDDFGSPRADRRRNRSRSRSKDNDHCKKRRHRSRSRSRDR